MLAAVPVVRPHPETRLYPRQDCLLLESPRLHEPMRFNHERVGRPDVHVRVLNLGVLTDRHRGYLVDGRNGVVRDSAARLPSPNAVEQERITIRRPRLIEGPRRIDDDGAPLAVSHACARPPFGVAPARSSHTYSRQPRTRSR